MKVEDIRSMERAEGSNTVQKTDLVSGSTLERVICQ